jgi:hypothetical protein
MARVALVPGGMSGHSGKLRSRVSHPSSWSKLMGHTPGALTSAAGRRRSRADLVVVAHRRRPMFAAVSTCFITSAGLPLTTNSHPERRTIFAREWAVSSAGLTTASTHLGFTCTELPDGISRLMNLIISSFPFHSCVAYSQMRAGLAHLDSLDGDSYKRAVHSRSAVRSRRGRRFSRSQESPPLWRASHSGSSTGSSWCQKLSATRP